MIVVVEPRNAGEHSGLLEDMFRLRARVFHDRLKWDVQVEDGMERDRYDDEAAVYILYVDEPKRQLIGSLRLLPTTGPTLLADFFDDTLPDAAQLTSPFIWECTRFCLDEKALGVGDRQAFTFASGSLVAALGQVALDAGIQTILGNFDAPMLRLYRRIGCAVEVLGSTQRYGRTVCLGSFEVSRPILNRIRARLEDIHPEVERSANRQPLAA
jgi:N-acyl-L-homoserine lactone synthetase